ncbi:MAG: UDP-glucose 4-epimerase GalE [Actinobacteria bacterium]|nr:UDP-glucose 4-epimerase GalE [Actinomycetota bacterium]MCA1722357.1 UDP-glucose 4-epimerase GalE [Actinomycetota bacterium]
MTWLVTGGAGYIGAHVVKAMLDDGQEVVALDDLSTGDASRVSGAPLVEGSVLDRALLDRTMAGHGVTGVVHIAAKKQVGESVADPLLYYRENLSGLVTLLEACRAADVGSFVFSSSAATYGLPDVDLVDEQTPGVPLSPYGETKLIGEWLTRDCETAFGLRTMSMRYFNVAGAASPSLGDPGVFNLIPLVFQALAAGEQPKVFGADYPTPDGTCIRDYVHVADIAAAHLAAARALAAGAASATYNIGRGEGSSVLEVLDVIGTVTGRDTTPQVVDRRPGDPARVVAAVDRIRDGLGFTATRDLTEMVESAWAGWQQRQ